MEIEWIFFDCFNTLIDDFDPTGDESGVKPIAHIPVKHGLYQQVDEFHQAYLKWRVDYWAKGNNDEVHLEHRFQSVLQEAKEKSGATTDLAPLIQEMIEAFHLVYPGSIRKSPKVESVLEAFSGKIKMGVVSNFFLPDYPEKLLREQGLDHYFNFIIDSAQIKTKKPGYEIYDMALARAGLDRSQSNRVLFVGDNIKNDVLIPMEIGMHAVHYDRSDVLKRKHHEIVKYTITDWTQFQNVFESITL
jgi:putative hydrolase of the HAD superfamily